MKKTLKIIQWLLTIMFAALALANAFHLSSIFFAFATVLFLPIRSVRDYINTELKMQKWLSVILAVLFFFVGINLSQISDTADNTSKISSVTSTLEDVLTSSENSYQNTSTETENNIASIYTESSDAETAHSKSDLSGNISSDKSAQNSSVTSGTMSIDNSLSSTGAGSEKATAVNPSDIPAYSGKPYVIINNNIPNFSASELTSKGYEKYSDLDRLGRTQAAIASVGKDTMPSADEERGSISNIKPTGWIQAKYDCVSGGWLYNRCHLIGWQLSAENANKSNLITGTKYLNINGMLPFENMVADYIEETNNHVAYRITPIYIGENLLASGVQMEAYSVEDNGDGICFNVYCYNVQPDITIDYSTGSSKEKNSNSYITSSSNSSSSSTQSTTKENSSNDTTTSISSESNDNMVWISETGSKYHSNSGCSNMKSPTQISKSKAESLGYDPCKKCW